VPKAERRFYALCHAVAALSFNAGAMWCSATTTRFRRGEVVVYGRCRCGLAERRSRASRRFFFRAHAHHMPVDVEAHNLETVAADSTVPWGILGES
jgi:hypothetical protein